MHEGPGTSPGLRAFIDLCESILGTVIDAAHNERYRVQKLVCIYTIRDIEGNATKR